MLGLLVLVVRQKQVMELEMLVLIAHGQMLQQALNLPQKAVVMVVLAVLAAVLVVQAEVLVIILVQVLTINLLNQAIVEHTDLDLMVVMVLVQQIIILAAVAVLVAQEMLGIQVVQDLVE